MLYQDFIESEDPDEKHSLYSVAVELRNSDIKPKPGYEYDEHYDFLGAAAQGKMESVSRVDWNWNALRREKGNSERNNQ